MTLNEHHGYSVISGIGPGDHWEVYASEIEWRSRAMWRIPPVIIPEAVKKPSLFRRFWSWLSWRPA